MYFNKEEMEKYYVIPKGSEKPFQKLILNWHTGIDAIEASDGNYILNEEAVKLLDIYPEIFVNIDEKSISVSEEVVKFEIKELKDIVFKTTEL
jgi:hypothetical protein